MTTDRRMEANRTNAQRSTGPKTAEGKARSRTNALKHGMSGAGEIAGASEIKLAERRASWGSEHRPQGESGAWAMERLVAASFQIERCERAFNVVLETRAARARLAWDLDRRGDAATIAAKLARDPLLHAHQLEATRHGCEMMIGLWDRLGAALEANGEWDDLERSAALDLLAIPAHLRDGRTPLDPPALADPATFHRQLVAEEVARLEEFVATALDPLDALLRRNAEAGPAGMLSKEAGLILRYERDAWCRYHEAFRDLRAPATAEVTPAPAPLRPAATATRPSQPAPAPVAAASPIPAFPRPIRPDLAAVGYSFVNISAGSNPARP